MLSMYDSAVNFGSHKTTRFDDKAGTSISLESRGVVTEEETDVTSKSGHQFYMDSLLRLQKQKAEANLAKKQMKFDNKLKKQDYEDKKRKGGLCLVLSSYSHPLSSS